VKKTYLLACCVIVAGGGALAQAQGEAPDKRVLVYIGKDPGSPTKLLEMVRSPVQVPSPSYATQGAVSIPRSADSHYYVHGFINGCPMLFMVDSGATTTTIQDRFAKVCGIQAGVVSEVETGGGRVKVGVSEGNRVGVGPVAIDKVTIQVSDKIPLSVLGMNILGKFKMSIGADGVMTLFALKQ